MPTVPAAPLEGASKGWSMSGFDAQHTNDNPLEQTLMPTNISTLQTAWTSYTGGFSLYPPIVADGILYLNTTQNIPTPDGNVAPISSLYAIGTQTSKVLWKQDSLPVTLERALAEYSAGPGDTSTGTASKRCKRLESFPPACSHLVAQPVGISR